MNKDLLNYFEKLGNIKFLLNGGYILDKDKNVEEVSPAKYNINGKDFYSKSAHADKYTMTEMSTSEMYNSIGLTTPPIYLMKKKDSSKTFIINQDVKTIDPNLEFQSADKIIDHDPFFRYREYAYPTNAIFDQEVQEKWHSIMTDECIEQYILMFLLDEIRTESDRFGRNYFFYRKKGNEKWEGVMPIDNELMSIVSTNDERFKSKEGFQTFLSQKYTSHDMLGHYIHVSYEDRMQDIKAMIYLDKLTDNQLMTLKSALEYNLPKTASKIQRKYNLKTTSQECIKRLWDYQHGEDGLAKEL